MIEIALAVFLFGIVLALAYPALFAGARLLGLVEDESRGQADLRTVEERMSRDLRAGRGVVGSSNNSHLDVWIDYNADYVRGTGETVTWRISASPRPNQFDVVRSVDSSPARSNVVGTTLVSDIAFGYSPGLPSPPASPVRVEPVQRVSVVMSYDAIPGLYSSTKISQFDIRLRNVE
ncbi:MAG TPA: hypothetical protein VMZ51_00530 [Acidimicrobiales bacterium]|nr:hypothetical protein [Acidimicrobiales bacterium]